MEGRGLRGMRALQLKGRGLCWRAWLPPGGALIGPRGGFSGAVFPAGRPGNGGGPRLEAAGATAADGGRRRPAHPLPLLALLQRAAAVRRARRPAPVRARGPRGGRAPAGARGEPGPEGAPRTVVRAGAGVGLGWWGSLRAWGASGPWRVREGCGVWGLEGLGECQGCRGCCGALRAGEARGCEGLGLGEPVGPGRLLKCGAAGGLLGGCGAAAGDRDPRWGWGRWGLRWGTELLPGAEGKPWQRWGLEEALGSGKGTEQQRGLRGALWGRGGLWLPHNPGEALG